MNDRKRLMEYAKRGYDLDFAAKIEPSGNPYFTSEYIRFGQGFVTCLNILDLPKKDMNDFWITPITENENTLTVIDFGTQNKELAIHDLKEALKETKTNIKAGGEEYSQEIIKQKYREQKQALTKIMNNEVIKTLNIKIFVYDFTYDDLMKKVKHIISTLSGKNIKVGINADELPFDFKSMFMPISKQELMLPNNPTPFSLTSDNLAGGYFFNHIMLDDPEGEFIGHTSTSGAVNFDMWHRDDERTSSNIFFLGNTRKGKSTLLKMLAEGNFVRNNFIRNFDISGEYKDLTIQMGGTIISLDGSQGSINPLQIFPTVTSDDGKSINKSASFYAHINKLKNIFNFLDVNLDDSALNLLQRLIKDFYVQQKMWSDDPNVPIENRPIFIKDEQYPIMEEFDTFLGQAKRKALGNNDSNENIERINRLQLVAQNMTENHKDIFNQTTTIPEFEEEQIVTFDISTLKSRGDNVFNAQVYSMLALTSSHAVKNGRIQLKKYESGKVDKRSIRHYQINIDECQNIITPKFPFGVEYIAKLEGEMSKLFCGISLATPTIETILPSKSINSDSNYEREVAKLFGNTQYRFFFQLDDSVLERIAEVMGGSMTKAELSSIPNLKKGQCVLNMGSRRNIPFNVYVQKTQIERFHGGN